MNIYSTNENTPGRKQVWRADKAITILKQIQNTFPHCTWTTWCMCQCCNGLLQQDRLISLQSSASPHFPTQLLQALELYFVISFSYWRHSLVLLNSLHPSFIISVSIALLISFPAALADEVMCVLNGHVRSYIKWAHV